MIGKAMFCIAITIVSLFNSVSLSNKQEEIIIPVLQPPVSNVDEKPLTGKVIVIDPGHGVVDDYSVYEAVAPGSTTTKPAHATGTRGNNWSEAELNLANGKLLKNKLEMLGATVYMTRATERSELSNIGRAKFGNEHNADLSIKLHADGSTNTNINGTCTLIPGAGCVTDYVYAESKRAGEYIQNGVVSKAGSVDRGVVQRTDMTGFNWSEVPVVIVEVGFMTNPQEDTLLYTPQYREKIAEGIADGVIKYFNEK